jgi:hypothetical protein
MRSGHPRWWCVPRTNRRLRSPARGGVGEGRDSSRAGGGRGTPEFEGVFGEVVN